MPNRFWSAAKPLAKASIQASPQSGGKHVTSRYPTGTAPLAARSDRLTRSSFCAISPGGSSGRKCTPATMASVLRTYCSPLAPGISAASSSSLRPPGAASGAKKRAMRSNSSRRGFAVTALLPELARPQPPRQVVEHAVDQSRLLGSEERMGDVEILVDDDLGRHVRAMRQFESAAAQDGAQHGFKPDERPIRRQRGRDRAVELGPVRRRARGDRAEKFLVGFAEILALAALAEAVGEELLDHLARLGLGQCDLVERLHRGKPRGCPLAAGKRVHRLLSAKRWRSAIMARQARAASPPLSFLSLRARAMAWRSFSTVNTPKPMASPRSASSWMPRAHSPQTRS